MTSGRWVPGRGRGRRPPRCGLPGRRAVRPTDPAPTPAVIPPGLVDPLVIARQAHQLGVDRLAPLVDEQVVQAPVSDHVLPQGHRPVLLDHDVGVAAHLGQPGPELLGVADGGRQGDHADVLGEVDDDLLPHRPALPVGEVVDLVHDHELQAGERVRAGVEHVAQDLGGHHHHRGIAVDRVVPGEQPDPLRSVALDQVVVLLVGQGLDRRRVEALRGPLDGQVDRELPHDGLAGAGGGSDQDAAPGQDARAGLLLEGVQPELVESAEPGQRGIVHGADATGVRAPAPRPARP